MQSQAKTPDMYISELAPERRDTIASLRKIIQKNIPKGFEEVMQYGMISYVVPHLFYPAGYHCKPSDPLPFISLASQKNHISFYHMGLYSEGSLLSWFTNEYPKYSDKKLDMGKCCIRWKKPGDIPLELIGQMVQKITPKEWINIYEKNIKK